MMGSLFSLFQGTEYTGLDPVLRMLGRSLTGSFRAISHWEQRRIRSSNRVSLLIFPSQRLSVSVAMDAGVVLQNYGVQNILRSTSTPYGLYCTGHQSK